MIETRTFGIHRRLALALIVAVALFLRILHIASYAPRPTSDMVVYLDMAISRLTPAKLFSPEGWYRFPPGYPIFLKPFTMAFDPDNALRAIQVAQALLSAGTCLAVYRIARILHSRRAGLAAALLTAFFSHFLFYTSVFMSESLFIPLYLAALLTALGVARRPSARGLYLAGLVSAAAVLTRPAGVSLAPALCYAAWRTAVLRRSAAENDAGDRPSLARARVASTLRAGARPLALVFAGGLTLLVPWAARNWIAYGRPVLISPNSAVNLWIGNHPGATGQFVFPPEPSIDPWELAAFHEKKAVEFIRSDPVGALLIALRNKWLAFWAFLPPWPLHSSNPELFAGSFFPLMISWRMVLPLGAIGLGVLLARRASPAWVTAACLAAYVVFYLIYFANSRFRLPAEGFFLVWAGAGVAGMARASAWLRSLRDRQWGAATGVLMIAVLAQAAIAAACTRASLARDDSIAASGPGLEVDFTRRSIPLLPEEGVAVDRRRERYLQVNLVARRDGDPGNPPNLGQVRLTFFDAQGRTASWIEGATYFLENLPSGRWTPVTFRAHVPTAAASCSLTLVPSKGYQDKLAVARPTLRYSRGNDLALEFLFPYLRYDE